MFNKGYVILHSIDISLKVKGTHPKLDGLEVLASFSMGLREGSHRGLQAARGRGFESPRSTCKEKPSA